MPNRPSHVCLQQAAQEPFHNDPGTSVTKEPSVGNRWDRERSYISNRTENSQLYKSCRLTGSWPTCTAKSVSLTLFLAWAQHLFPKNRLSASPNLRQSPVCLTLHAYYIIPNSTSILTVAQRFNCTDYIDSFIHEFRDIQQNTACTVPVYRDIWEKTAYR